MAEGEGKKIDLNEVRIILDLERLGELIAHVATAFCEIRGLEPPDYSGQEMKDLALSGWHHVLHMSDRAEFASSVHKDLEALESLPTEEPQHRSEFGL